MSTIAGQARGFAETISEIEIVIRIVIRIIESSNHPKDEASNPPAAKCRFACLILEIDDDPKERSERTLQKNDPREAVSIPGVVVKTRTLSRPANLIPKIDSPYEDRQSFSDEVGPKDRHHRRLKGFFERPLEKSAISLPRMLFAVQGIRKKKGSKNQGGKRRQKDPAYPERDSPLHRSPLHRCGHRKRDGKRGMGNVQGLSKTRSPGRNDAGSMPDRCPRTCRRRMPDLGGIGLGRRIK